MAEEAGKYDPIDRNEDYVAAGSDCVNMAQGAVYSGGMARNTMPHFWNLGRRKQQIEKRFCLVWADSIVDIDAIDVNIESAFYHRAGVFCPVIAKYGLNVECNSSLCFNFLLHSKERRPDDESCPSANR